MVTSVLSFKPRRLPSHLSGLVAERARADGHISRLQLLIDDLQSELQGALTTRESCDVLIAKAFAASPEIDPVAAWRGRYGKRGAIRNELTAHLADAYPEARTSKQLADHLCQVLGIDFPTQAAATQWIKTNVNGSLTRLRKRGLVEALHDTSPVGRDGNAYGAWRWSPEGAKPTSVSELASLAASAGIEVGQASMKTELEPEDEPTAEVGDEEGAFIPSRPRRNKSTRRRTRNALERLVAELEDARAKAERERDAADHLIRAYAPSLDPTDIEPTAGWKGRYGRRGALSEFIREQVRSAHPELITTAEIAARAAVKFELDLATPTLYDAWRKTAIRNQLQRMEKAGEVERVGLDGKPGQLSASWLWLASN